VADAFGIGSGASSLGQPDLAIHADLFLGCMIFDAIIAIWFLVGAPPLIGRRDPTSQTALR
jgi:hypothetical protein